MGHGLPGEPGAETIQLRRDSTGGRNIEVFFNDRWIGIGTLGTASWGGGFNTDLANLQRVNELNDRYRALADRCTDLLLAAPETAIERDGLRAQNAKLLKALKRWNEPRVSTDRNTEFCLSCDASEVGDMDEPLQHQPGCPWMAARAAIEEAGG